MNTQRKNIQDWIENFQTSDCYDIGACQLNWISGRQEWQLILPNKEIHTQDACKGVDRLLAKISDEDIADYYAGIEEHYAEDIPAEEKELAK